jgi:GWxTD domain-containing protein
VSVAALALLALLQGPEAARAQFSNQGMPTPDATPAPGTSATRPRFSVDATLQPGDSAAEVRIDYRMGRDELLFERAEDGYRAAYEIRVIFYKSKGGAQVTGDAFERNLHVRNYADTRLRGADVIDHVALRVPPGKYRVQVVITDLVAERASGTEIPFEVLAAGKNLVWFSDLSLGTVADSAASGAGSGTREHFVPVPARRFGLDLPTLAVIGEVVDGRPAPPDGTIEHYKVAVRVLNDLQEEVWKADTLLARTGARTPFMIRPRLGAIAAGSYRVALDLLSPSITPPGKKKPVPVHRERNFDVDQTSENVAWESRASLEVLRYVATNEEKDEMDRLSSPDARKTFWESFWKRRDPTSETERNEALEEFYRRVQYSNQHFSVGIAGWRTDMGRLYIKLGAPDEIVRNPFNFDRPPEEIWFYYPTQRRFVFVDRDGFGRFELDGKQSSAED